MEAPKPAAIPGELAGQPIELIEFRGARRVPQDTLKALIVSRLGDLYNEDALRRDFMALWNTGRFDDIRLESEAGRTAQDGVSEIRTALIAARAGLDGNLPDPYLTTVLEDAEDALSSSQESFRSLQPPADAEADRDAPRPGLRQM